MWQAWSAVSFVDDARHETTQAPAGDAVLLLDVTVGPLDGEIYGDRSDWFARARVRKCVSARRAGNNHTRKTSNIFPSVLYFISAS